MATATMRSGATTCVAVGSAMARVGNEAGLDPTLISIARKLGRIRWSNHEAGVRLRARKV